MTGDTMKKIKYFIPSFIIMIIIFIFSQANGDQSGGMSLGIVEIIQKVFPFITDIDVIHTLIRKIAHMCEYALLCFSFIFAFFKNGYNVKQVCFYSILFTFFYACSDEFHQTFIPERSGNMIDVMIDSIGGMFAVIIYKWRNRHGI